MTGTPCRAAVSAAAHPATPLPSTSRRSWGAQRSPDANRRLFLPDLDEDWCKDVDDATAAAVVERLRELERERYVAADVPKKTPFCMERTDRLASLYSSLSDLTDLSERWKALPRFTRRPDGSVDENHDPPGRMADAAVR